VKEYPFFFPYEEERLAATLTVPDDGQPEALVLLLAGTGAARSHRFQLWTRTARALAENGLASIRMDYRGIGDSTGRLIQPVLGDHRLEQAIAAARFGMVATGIDRLGAVGNCSGGIVALGVAARMPECSAAICILPRLVKLGGVNRTAMEMRKSRVAGVMRKNRVLRWAVRETMKGPRDMPSQPVQDSFEAALEHADVLFVYSDRDRDPYVGKSRRLLGQLASKLSPPKRARLSVMVTPEGPLAGFESLSAQAMAIDLVTQWMTDRLAGHPGLAGMVETLPAPEIA
jgi:pimeloyl-ACP methyl ester carboxylesterase